MLDRQMWSIVCVAVLALVASAKAEDGTPTALTGLVDQLGTDAFTARRSAAMQLTKLGIGAQDSLVAGLQHADPEARRACRRLLADVYKQDYARRIREFAADASGKREHDLPGWHRFQEVVGGDQASRELFTKMYEAEEGLLCTLHGDADATVHNLDMRFRLLLDQLGRPNAKKLPPSLGSIAAVLFVATDPELTLPTTVANQNYWTTLIQQPAMNEALKKGPHQVPAKRLVGLWITNIGSSALAPSKVQLAIRYKLDAGIDLGMEMLADTTQPSYYRPYAINAVGQLGGKTHAHVIAQSLQDKSVCNQRTVVKNKKATTLKTEVRDVALAWLIHLTGQEHKAYNLPNAKAVFDRLKRSPTSSLSAYQLCFESDAYRKAAFQKWEVWQAANPLPKMPADAETRWNALVKQASEKKQVNNPPAIAKKQDDVAAPVPGLPSTLQYDRQMARKLTRARQLIEEGEVSEAAVLLGKILEAKEDYVYRPDRRLTLSVGIRAEAERLIGAMPPVGIDEYRRYYGLTAKSRLEQAIGASNIDDVASVARRYFHTRAGQQAAYLVASHHLNQQQSLSAALLFQRLQDRSIDANVLEPELSLQLASAWYLAGMIDRAEQTLVRMKALYPQETLTIDGQLSRMFAADANALAWLSRQIDLPAATPPVEGWFMYRGDQSRNQHASGGLPYLRAKQIDEMVPPSDFQRLIDKLATARQDEHRPSFLTIHPLRIGETLVARTARSIRAWDIPTATMIWEATASDALVDLIQDRSEQPDVKSSEAVRLGLERRLWDDHTYGTLSSNGELLFAVEDLPFGVGADFLRLAVSPNGKRRLDFGALTESNTLTAYDLKTGKVRWEVGGATEDESVRSESLFFLGPPLAMGSRLYAIAQQERRTRLLELDAATGNRLWDLTLVEREQLPKRYAAMNMPMTMYEQRSHRSGASPSSSAGVLVCPLSDGDYVGVDLTTRTVLWVYRTPQEMPTINPLFGNVFQQRMLAESSVDVDDRWIDTSVTIADDRILITPAASGKLLCLDLATGSMMWTKSRADGFYIAGARDGRAIIVGRGSIRAINLADGKPSWPNERVMLPPGAVPTGRGLLTESECIVPLSTGEVAAFDLATGNLVARSHARDNHVPGNLIATDNGYVSQTPAGIFVYPLLSAREAELRKQLAADPDNELQLAELGEVLLFQGRAKEAVEYLTRVHNEHPTGATREMLASAMLHGVSSDFDAFADLASLAETFINDPEQRVKYLMGLAVAHERRNDVQAAFSTYLRLIDLDEGLTTVEHVAASRAVRRERWLAGRLDTLWRNAGAGDRTWMQNKIDEVSKAEPHWVLRWLPAHPNTNQLRIEVAGKLAADDKWLRAEQLLLTNVGSGNGAQQSAAVGHLAKLMTESKQFIAASDYMHLAAHHFANDVVTDGLTGSALLKKNSKDDAFKRILGPDDRWPLTRPNSTAKKLGRSYQYDFPIRVMSNSPLMPTHNAIRIDNAGTKVTGYDAVGQPQWTVKLNNGPTKSRTYRQPFQQTARVISRGHRHVVWLESRIAVIDAQGKEATALWSQDIFNDTGTDARLVQLRMMRAQMRSAPSPFPAGESRPFAVCGDVVVFNRDRKLFAVDIETGDVLWQRNRFAEVCDLYGDDQFILVTTRGSDEAIVLSTFDGREVGRRSIPIVEERILTAGRNVLSWTKTQEGHTLTMFDPWIGQAIWSRDFAPKSQPSCIADRVAVLQPSGAFVMLDVLSGRIAAKLQVAAMPDLESIYVHGRGDQVVLIANRKTTPENDGVMFVNQIGNQVATTAPVNGEVYGLDLAAQQQRWTKTVTNQLIALDQPTLMPIVTFANFTRTYGQQVNGRTTTTSRFDMLVLDRRHGGDIHKERDTSYRYPYMMTYDVVADDKKIKIHDQRTTVEIQFGDAKADK